MDSVAAVVSIADSLAKHAPVDTLKELTQALALLDDMHAAMSSLLVFEQKVHTATEEQRQLLRIQAEEHVKTVRDAPSKLLELIAKLEEKGAPVDSIRALFKDFVHENVAIYGRSFTYLSDQLNQLRSQRGVIPGEQLGDLESMNASSSRPNRIFLCSTWMNRG